MFYTITDYQFALSNAIGIGIMRLLRPIIYTSVSYTILPSRHVGTEPVVSIARLRALMAARRIAASAAMESAERGPFFSLFCFALAVFGLAINHLRIQSVEGRALKRHTDPTHLLGLDK